MRCIATEVGHDGKVVRDVGESFDVDDSRIGQDGMPADGSTWYRAESVDPDAPARPRTLVKKP